MVMQPRAPLDAHQLRTLKLPLPLSVRGDPDGSPRSVERDDWPAPREVVRLEERWRIDDEWWRERPVARLYYRVRLADGTLLTLYHDLADGRWYEQRYGTVERAARRVTPERAARRGT